MVKLSFDDRKEIEKLISHGISMTNIAKTLHLPKTNMQKEIAHNGGREGYKAENAQYAFEQKELARSKKGKDAVNAFADSNEQVISGMLNDGKNIFEIKKITGASFFIIKVIAQRYKFPFPSVYAILEHVFKRIDEMESKPNKEVNK